MAQFTFNSMSKLRYIGEEMEPEPQGREGDSVRDAVLKQIKDNHLKSTLSLEELRKHKEKFVLSSKQRDSTHSTKGLLEIESFKRKCDDFDVSESLSSCGLSDEEISILLTRDERRGKATDEAFRRKLVDIKEKIEQRQKNLTGGEDRFAGVVELNRHDFEEECKRVPSASAERLTRCLVKCKPYSDPFLPPDHPMNSLQELEKRLFPPQDPEEGKPSPKRPKRRSEANQIQFKYLHSKPITFWDMKETPIIVSQEPVAAVAINNCTPIVDNTSSQFSPIGISNLNTKGITSNTFKSSADVSSNTKTNDVTREKRKDFSKPFIWALREPQLVPESVIKENRITTEAIKNQPSFSSYHPGNPSATLYIKNLPVPCDPLSIVSLFGRFEEENGTEIEYRILKGRMKGQAFVKFRSTDVAVKAFSLCNGFVLAGRPIVLQYGRTEGN